MSIHPIEYRYGSDEIKRIFSKDNWLKLFINVELAILRSLEKHGVIPKGTSSRIEKRVKGINMDDVKRWEESVRHESMAVVLAMHERSGEEGKYIHLGATSNDILDTILGIQIREAGKIIVDGLDELIRELILIAWNEKDTPCLGRTHGKAAVPVTFGFKLLLFIDELDRARDRLVHALSLSTVGKYSGAVGTGVELGEMSRKIEEDVLSGIGLKTARHSTQIIPRDIYAHLFTSLSIVSSILDQFGREIRNLQRSGIEEVMEPFGDKQVGSSVMPHKRNPVLSEKICGLSKVIRGLCLGWLENIVIEHERDLTNSSFERIAIPEAFILIDEQIRTARHVIRGLKINRDYMLRNIEREGIWIYSDLLVQMVALRGGDRQKAHEHIRGLAVSGAGVDDILEDNYLASYIRSSDLDMKLLLRRCVESASMRTEGLLLMLAGKYGVSLSS